MANFNPTLAVPIMESVRLTPLAMETAGAEPILDEQGNPILDEKGCVIYGD